MKEKIAKVSGFVANFAIPRHGLAVFAALTPPPKVAKVASTAAVSAASAVSEAPAMTATVAEVPEAPPMAAAPAVAPDGAFNLNQRVLFRGQGALYDTLERPTWELEKLGDERPYHIMSR